eukprot:Skav213445  [mRNA]  locus=scaffold837:244391:245743:+ [translate_table: standard]
MILAGFPCQPYSKQGSQLGSADDRSNTLDSVLEAGWLLQSSGLVLECVPEAREDPSVQRKLRTFAQARGFRIHQQILSLSDLWPSRRNRWSVVLLPWGCNVQIPPLPVCEPKPVVHDLMPCNQWPLWDAESGEKLQWTPLEIQVDANKPLPTALHSWGNALYACPCACRSQGLQASRLRRQGLRGLEIKSGAWPYPSRHIHPRELQLFLGFRPFEHILEDVRGQLCLYGNSVSPIQAIWILAHVQDQAGTGSGLSPPAMLKQYLHRLLQERDLTWPWGEVRQGYLQLSWNDTQVDILFNSTQTLAQLLQAEAKLSASPFQLSIVSEGQTIPEFAFLQEREYQVIEHQVLRRNRQVDVPLLLVHLGEVRLRWAEHGISYRTFVNWAGVSTFLKLLDAQGHELDPNDQVSAWTQVTVQLDPEDLAFELGLLEEGYGLTSHLIAPDSRLATGL